MKYLRSSLTRTAGRWLLSLALSLVLTGSVRAVVWHAEPRTNWLGTNALVLIAQPRGTGYLTRTITWSNLVTGLASQDWVTASLTNSFWQTNFVFWTNYLGTTNFNFWTNYIATHAAANNTWTNTGTEIRTLTGLPVVVSNQLQGEYTGDGTNHGLAVLAPSAGGVGADLTLWSLADATAAFKGLDLSISPDSGPLLSGVFLAGGWAGGNLLPAGYQRRVWHRWHHVRPAAWWPQT